MQAEHHVHDEGLATSLRSTDTESTTSRPPSGASVDPRVHAGAPEHTLIQVHVPTRHQTPRRRLRGTTLPAALKARLLRPRQRRNDCQVGHHGGGGVIRPVGAYGDDVPSQDVHRRIICGLRLQKGVTCRHMPQAGDRNIKSDLMWPALLYASPVAHKSLKAGVQALDVTEAPLQVEQKGSR